MQFPVEEDLECFWISLSRDAAIVVRFEIQLGSCHFAPSEKIFILFTDVLKDLQLIQ